MTRSELNNLTATTLVPQIDISEDLFVRNAHLDYVDQQDGVLYSLITGSTANMSNYYTKAQTDTYLVAKADLVGGLIPSNQLPSFVDDVLEYANLAAFPVSGETGKIYVAIDTNFSYRWSGSTYIQIISGNFINNQTSSAQPSSGFWLSGNGKFDGYVEIAEQSAPSTPSSGYGRIYIKSDGKLYFKNDNGVEKDLTSGGVVSFTNGSGFNGSITGGALSLTTSLTTGSIPFIGSSGALSEDNSNFYWDNTNKRLGIGGDSTYSRLEVREPGYNIPAARFYAGGGSGIVEMIDINNGARKILFGTVGNDFRIIAQNPGSEGLKIWANQKIEIATLDSAFPISVNPNGSYVDLQGDTKITVGNLQVGSSNQMTFNTTDKQLYLYGSTSSRSSLRIDRTSAYLDDFIKMNDLTTGGSITIGNVASSNFTPSIQFNPSSGQGSFWLANTDDTGTSLPAMFFDGRKTSGALATQDPVWFGSYLNPYMKIKAGGNIEIMKLSTDFTAPAQSGYVSMVTTDANGRLSFADIPTSPFVESTITTSDNTWQTIATVYPKGGGGRYERGLLEVTVSGVSASGADGGIMEFRVPYGVDDGLALSLYTTQEILFEQDVPGLGYQAVVDGEGGMLIQVKGYSGIDMDWNCVFRQTAVLGVAP